MSAAGGLAAPERPRAREIRDLATLPWGTEVTIRGWLTRTRRAARTTFLRIADRTGQVQCVARTDSARFRAPGENDRWAVVTGTLRPARSPRQAGGDREIEVRAIETIPGATAPAPEPPRSRELRERRYGLAFEVQHTLEGALRDALRDRRFWEVHTPKTTLAGTESGAELFGVDYFGTRLYLSQSPQFYLQLAIAGGLERVFEVGPVFRAESGETNRHASEFTSLDVELAWVEHPAELMELEERLLHHALSCVRDRHGGEIATVFGLDVEIPALPVPRLTVDEAAELAGEGASHAVERAASHHAYRSTGCSFVFLTDYRPADRPFYAMRDRRSGRSRSFDLVWRGMEVSSGAQREHRSEPLRGQLDEQLGRSEDVARYLEEHYLAMFDEGCPPHGGFGIGLNRLVMALLGRPRIEDTMIVPRGPSRWTP